MTNYLKILLPILWAEGRSQNRSDSFLTACLAISGQENCSDLTHKRYKKLILTIEN